MTDMTMTENNWLAALGPGDVVAVSKGYNGESLTKVERVTATQIVLAGDRRFNRKSGQRVGERDRWYSEFLFEPTPEVLARIERRRRIATLSNTRWEDLPDFTLAAVIVLLPRRAGDQ
jgi:hypothetical protein